MMTESDSKNINILVIIVNSGIGSKVLKIARQNGISGGTIFLGRGTTKPYLYRLFDLGETKKEIVLLLADHELGSFVLTELNRHFEFGKPHHGIAFKAPISDVFGLNCYYNLSIAKRSEHNTMYKALFVIVDRGMSESVLEASYKAGGKGGTIINARGAGVHENQTLFSMAIEPEKEIVMIITEIEKSEAIMASIRSRLEIDKPGHGVMFAFEVDQAYGLFE